MARTNWDWIDAVNPTGPAPRGNTRHALDRRLGSFWNKRVQREVRPVAHLYGEDGLMEREAYVGKVVDSTDEGVKESKSRGRKAKGMEFDKDGQMRIIY